MATWTDPATINTSPDSPVTSEFGTAALENPEAIAEGAAGAPRVIYGAKTVGAYTFGYSTAGDQGPGDTVAGSTLRATSALRGMSGAAFTSSWNFTHSGTLSGTWECMGEFTEIEAAGVDARGSTLWLRIS